VSVLFDMAFNSNRRKFCHTLKGLSHETFRPVFLACMDASRLECEPLVVLKCL
jgi:hypothetical protein